MPKNLRADMSSDEFRRFKSLMNEAECSTNDEFIIELMDTYEENELND